MKSPDSNGRRAAVLALSLLLLAILILRSAPNVGAAATTQIVGTVRLDGTPPRQEVIDMSGDPTCAQTHVGEPPTKESVVVGPDRELANVVVYISQGLSGTEPSSTQAVTLEQKGCQYVPHVIAVNPGQHFSIVNDDKTLHNIHPSPRSGGGNNSWNRSQPAGSPPLEVSWPNEEVAIPVKCNVHPWMRAYMVVVKGPYSVSNASGSFALDAIPPGTYTVTAWHEIYGTLTQNLTVAAGKPATIDFTFKAK